MTFLRTNLSLAIGLVALGTAACGAPDDEDLEDNSSDINQRRSPEKPPATKKRNPRATPTEVQSPLSSLDAAALPVWTRSQLDSAFSRVRDTRRFFSDFAVNDEPENFPRRLPWLFPGNGCEVRAIFAEQMISKAEEGWEPPPSPKRIFLYPPKGKLLRFETPLEEDGAVEWKVHIANIVQVDGQPWILDAAVEARRPIGLSDWAGRVFSDVSVLRAAVCNANSYRPNDDPCEPAAPAARDEAEASLRMTLRMEWATIKNSGRDPLKLLGDAPPWLGSPE